MRIRIRNTGGSTSVNNGLCCNLEASVSDPDPPDPYHFPGSVSVSKDRLYADPYKMMQIRKQCCGFKNIEF